MSSFTLLASGIVDERQKRGKVAEANNVKILQQTSRYLFQGIMESGAEGVARTGEAQRGSDGLVGCVGELKLRYYIYGNVMTAIAYFQYRF